MTNYDEYFIPDDLKYIFIEPISLFWAKKVTNPQTQELQSIKIGFTELMTKNLKKDELRFNFRSENLPLRLHKPFLRLLTRNKYFEFLSPWRCEWTINPELKNLSFIDHPYEHHIIECHNFAPKDDVEKQLQPKGNFDSQIKSMIAKELFKDCKDCPDFLQSSATRRIKTND